MNTELCNHKPKCRYDTTLTSTVRLVYEDLVERADPGTHQLCTRTKVIAKDFDYCTETIDKAIQKLEKKGYISKVYRHNIRIITIL